MKKINISTFFLILSIIIILVIGFFIYKLNNNKIEIQKFTELQEQVNDLNKIIFNFTSNKGDIKYLSY